MGRSFRLFFLGDFAERMRCGHAVKKHPRCHNAKMTTEEDIAWFKSTFRPIPKPELPDDSVEYFVYHLPAPAPAVIDDAAETRARLLQVQRTAADLTKELLKDYIWQRESFRLEIKKDDGMFIQYKWSIVTSIA